MFHEPITFKRKSGLTFLIDPVIVYGEEDSLSVALRIWLEGQVVNGPKLPHYDTVEDAFDAGFAFCKAWKEKA